MIRLFVLRRYAWISLNSKDAYSYNHFKQVVDASLISSEQK